MIKIPKKPAFGERGMQEESVSSLSPKDSLRIGPISRRKND